MNTVPWRQRRGVMATPAWKLFMAHVDDRCSSMVLITADCSTHNRCLYSNTRWIQGGKEYTATIFKENTLTLGCTETALCYPQSPQTATQKQFCSSSDGISDFCKIKCFKIGFTFNGSSRAVPTHLHQRDDNN